MGVVRYLLDTHTLLWAIQKDVDLSDTVKAIITCEDLQKFVSPVSARVDGRNQLPTPHRNE